MYKSLIFSLSTLLFRKKLWSSNKKKTVWLKYVFVLVKFTEMNMKRNCIYSLYTYASQTEMATKLVTAHCETLTKLYVGRKWGGLIWWIIFSTQILHLPIGQRKTPFNPSPSPPPRARASFSYRVIPSLARRQLMMLDSPPCKTGPAKNEQKVRRKIGGKWAEHTRKIGRNRKHVGRKKGRWDTMLEFLTRMRYHFRQKISGIHKHVGGKMTDGVPCLSI